MQFQCSTQRAIADQLLLIEHVDREILVIVLSHVTTARLSRIGMQTASDMSGR